MEYILYWILHIQNIVRQVQLTNFISVFGYHKQFIKKHLKYPSLINTGCLVFSYYTLNSNWLEPIKKYYYTVIKHMIYRFIKSTQIFVRSLHFTFRASDVIRVKNSIVFCCTKYCNIGCSFSTLHYFLKFV